MMPTRPGRRSLLEATGQVPGAHSVLSGPLWHTTLACSLLDSFVHESSLGKNPGVGCHALRPGIFPTQGSNPGLPRCRWILYHLNHRVAHKYWYGWPILSPEDLPDLQGIKPGSPALQVDS